MTLHTVELLNIGGIAAYSTLRGAAVAMNPYDGFSTCSYTSDSPERVQQAIQLLSRHTGLGTDRLIFPRQTHSLNVKLIDRTPFPADMLADTDALVTTLTNTVLCIHTADCVPVLLADAEAGVIAAAHSGWKGTVGGISALTVQKMVEAGARPDRIVAAMGPCICAGCFEVGEEVVERFMEAGFPPAVVSRDASFPRPHIDLPAAVRHTLIQSGILDCNISLPPGCSYCSPDKYFSARRLGIKSGRTLSYIMMGGHPVQTHR